MKKTSLMLAIAALLYGTSSAYVLADEVVHFHPKMKPAEVIAFLKTVPADPSETQEDDGFTEGGPDKVDSPAGLEPFDKLPAHVYVDNDIDEAIYKSRMCPDTASYKVNGFSMARFPVEVITTPPQPGIIDPIWEQGNDLILGDFGYASGDGWLLVQAGDTWYLDNPWMLYTSDGYAVEKIVLKPIIDTDKNGIKYAFDVGGFGKKDTTEHTAGAERGRALTVKVAPGVDFTATYSAPVYVKNPDVSLPSDDLHADGNGNGTDSSNAGPDETPTHDLYGYLTIEFSQPIESAEIDAVAFFSFIADTDCVLRVSEAQYDSYDASTGEVNFTLRGDGGGLAVMVERCGAAPEVPVTDLFEVSRDVGEGSFSVPLTPQKGCCYSVRVVNDDGSLEEKVKLLGIASTDNEVCM